MSNDQSRWRHLKISFNENQYFERAGLKRPMGALYLHESAEAATIAAAAPRIELISQKSPLASFSAKWPKIRLVRHLEKSTSMPTMKITTKKTSKVNYSHLLSVQTKRKSTPTSTSESKSCFITKFPPNLLNRPIEYYILLISGVISRGRMAEALNTVLKNAPLGSKNQQVKV
jgi:hypothetical protein